MHDALAAFAFAFWILDFGWEVLSNANIDCIWLMEEQNKGFP